MVRLAVLLGAMAPGCFLPELVIDASGSGGTGANDLGGAGSGGDSSDGAGGTTSGGASTDGSGGSSSGGDGGSPGGSGGDGSGGAGSGGASGGAGSGGGASYGYYENGPWQGYVGTYSNLAMILPTDFDDAVSPPYCVTGDVSPDVDFQGQAGWTWNLNQEPDCTLANCGTVTPTAEGIQLTIDNNLDTALRIQVRGPDGDTDLSQRWCATLPAPTGTMFVPWSEFYTCLTAGAEQYANEELVSLQIFAPGPGGGQPAADFDFCVESVEERDLPPPTCSLSDPAGTGAFNLSGSNFQQVDRGGITYVAHSNVWQATEGTQIIIGEGTAFEITEQTAMLNPAGGAFSFPSVFIGDQNGIPSGSPTLPVALNNIADLPTAWAWTPPASGTYLALYELSLANTAGADTANAYIQILLGGANADPIGSYLADVEIGGRYWEVYSGPTAASQPVTTYRNGGAAITAFEESLAPFVTDAINRGLSPSLYLFAIAAGFEVWSGSVGASSDNFCALVE